MALEAELVDKEERLRAAVSTRQEFAGQLVIAQQRELTVMTENAKLVETQVNIIYLVHRRLVGRVNNFNSRLMSLIVIDCFPSNQNLGKTVVRFGRGTGKNQTAGGDHREGKHRVGCGQRETFQTRILRGKKLGFP